MALQFAAAVGLLNLYSERVVGGVIETTRGLFQQSFRRELSVGELQSLAAAVLRDGMSFVFPLGFALVAIGLLMHLGQTGFALSAKKLTPDLNRLNPLAKLRDLPGENLLQTFKAVVLLPLFGAVLWHIVTSRLDLFLSLAAMTARAGTVAVSHAVMDLLMKAAVCLVVLGLFDLYRQRRRLSVKLKMTKEEVRREHKDLEGDPHIKARIRRLRREMMRRRMMSEVPKATVVITNPTHYAVAWIWWRCASAPSPKNTASRLWRIRPWHARSIAPPRSARRSPKTSIARWLRFWHTSIACAASGRSRAVG